MSDIVQRLRDRSFSSKFRDPLLEEAADEIERLRNGACYGTDAERKAGRCFITLTDIEREAVGLAMHRCDGPEYKTLRALLARLA